MAYTNSPLVSYTKLSPNNSGQRRHAIDTITPHCVVGQATVEGLGDYFYPSANQVSANYGIGCDGRVGMYVEEKNRSWCSSSSDNDNRAITIECASDTKEPYAFRDAVYETLIQLCTDICKRYGKKKLLWLNDKGRTLAYQPAEDEMVLTVHRWFYAQKSCPGTWMMNHMDDLAEKVTTALNQGENPAESTQEPEPEQEQHQADIVPVTAETNTKSNQNTSASVGLQGRDVAQMGIEKALNLLGPIFTEEQRKYGLLASVMLAQAIAESGLNNDLFKIGNAAFSMKCMISGNTWAGTVWDGESSYAKTWTEYYNGKAYTSTDYYRTYPDLEHSIEDHRNYLLNAMNGDAPRYAGLAGCTDAKEAAEIIYKGGYCTDPEYANALLHYIDLYHLDEWNAVQPNQDEQPAIQEQTGGTPAEYKGIPMGEWVSIKETVKTLYQIVMENEKAGGDG